MNESEWTRNICKSLESQIPIIITPLTASKRSIHGISDRHFNSKIWCGFVEFKGERTKLTKLQQRFLEQQNKVTPGSAFIWRKNTEDSIYQVVLQDWKEDKIIKGSALRCLEEMSRIYRNA